jgi:hypothetical protein
MATRARKRGRKGVQESGIGLPQEFKFNKYGKWKNKGNPGFNQEG